MPTRQVRCDNPSPQLVVSPQTIFLQAPLKSPEVYENYSIRKSLVLGILQICIGLLSTVSNLVAILFVGTALAYIAHGVWCGLFFCVAGGFGIAAGRMKTKKMIMTFMVTSVVSALLSSAFLGISITATTLDVSLCQYSYGNGYRNGYGYSGSYGCNKIDGMIAVSLIMGVLALLEALVAILSSVICCSVICCGARNTQGQMIRLSVPMVQYAQTGTPQEIVRLTSPQQPLVENMEQPGKSQRTTSPPPEYNSRTSSLQNIQQKDV